jgi:heat shock protein HslJ
MLRRLLTLIGIGFMLMACASTPSISNTVGIGEWQLVQLGDTPVDGLVTMQLQDNGNGAYIINGQGFCNVYNAPATANGDTLTVADVASTRRMCPDPQMSNERDYFAALKATTQIVLDAGKLQFRDVSGKTLLTFTQ